jgi:hypothetical protein
MEWTNWIPPGNGGGGVFTIGGDLDTLSIVGNSFHDNQMANNNLGHVFYLGHAGNTYATAARNIEISYNIVNEQRNIGYFLHQWSGSFSYVPWNVAVKNNLVNLKGISGFLIAPAAGGPRNWQVWDNDIRVDGSDPRNQNQAPLDSSAYCSAIDFYQGEALNSGGVWSNGVDSTFDMRRNVFVVKGGNGPVVRMKTVSGSGTQHNPTHASNQYWNTVSNGNVVGGDRAAFYSVSGETVAAPATQATGFQDKATLFTGSLKLPPGFWKSKVDGTNSLGNASVTSSNVVEVTELVGAGTMPSSYSVAPITVTPSSIQVGVNGNASFTVTDKTGYELAGAQCVSASTARATVSSTTDADGVATVTGISGPSTTITISFLDPVTNSTVTYDLPVVVTGGATSDTGFFNFVPL